MFLFAQKIFQHSKCLLHIFIWALSFSKSNVRWSPKRSVPDSVVLRWRIWGSVERGLHVASRRQIYKWYKFVTFQCMKQVWLPLWICLLNFILVLFLIVVVLAVEVDWDSRAAVELFTFSGLTFGFLKLFAIIPSSSFSSIHRLKDQLLLFRIL